MREGLLPVRAETPSGTGRSRLEPGPQGHARKFVENRRAYVHKARGLFQIGPQLRDLPFQPVKRRLPQGHRLLAGLLLPPVPSGTGNARRKPRLSLIELVEDERNIAIGLLV